MKFRFLDSFLFFRFSFFWYFFEFIFTPFEIMNQIFLIVSLLAIYRIEGQRFLWELVIFQLFLKLLLIVFRDMALGRLLRLRVHLIILSLMIRAILIKLLIAGNRIHFLFSHWVFWELRKGWINIIKS